MPTNNSTNKGKHKRKRKKNPAIILLIIIVILYIITEIAPVIVERTVSTVIIEHEELVVEEEVECYALRSETIYSAPTNGNVKYIYENGDLVKVGAKVLDFQETSDDNSGERDKYSKLIDRAESPKIDNVEYAPRKGIFTTYLDGNEKYFVLENYKNITEEKAKARKDQTVDVNATKVGNNQPLYKISDQSAIYLMCWIESGSVSKYREGDVVEVKFDEDTNVKFTIERIDKEGSKWKMLMGTNRYFEEFADFRSKKVKIVSSDMEGLKIPNSALTTKNGVVGVMVGDKSGEFNFVPVKIITSDGEHSIVKGNIYYDEKGNLVNTVRIYDEILRKPKVEDVNE